MSSASTRQFFKRVKICRGEEYSRKVRRHTPPGGGAKAKTKKEMEEEALETALAISAVEAMIKGNFAVLGECGGQVVPGEWMGESNLYDVCLYVTISR